LCSEAYDFDALSELVCSSQGDPETSICDEVAASAVRAASAVKTTCRSELIRYQNSIKVSLVS